MLLIHRVHRVRSGFRFVALHVESEINRMEIWYFLQDFSANARLIVPT